MNKKRFLVLLVAAVAIVSLLVVGCAPAVAPPPEEGAPPPEEEKEAPPAAPEEEVIHWKFAGMVPRGTMWGITWEQFASDVERMSGGRLLIEVIYAGEGYTEPEVLDVISSGVIECGTPYQALHQGVLPAGVIELGLPGAMLSVTEFSTLFHEKGWIDVLGQAYGEHNLYYTAEYYQPGTYLITKEPINTLDDLKKMKVRAPGAYGAMLSNAGASAVEMAYGEIYTGLATGVIDGADGCNIVDHRDSSFYEVAPYLYPLPVTSSQIFNIVVNMDAWNSLSDDLKAIVEEAARWHGIVSAHKTVIWQQEAVNEMLGKGLQWSPAPSEADKAKWIEAGMAIWDDYAAKDAYSAELIRILEEFMEELGY